MGIVERLRETAHAFARWEPVIADEVQEAADRIKQLEAALRIIVRKTTAVSPDVLNQQMCIDAVNRHAIAALKEIEGD